MSFANTTKTPATKNSPLAAPTTHLSTSPHLAHHTNPTRAQKCVSDYSDPVIHVDDFWLNNCV